MAIRAGMVTINKHPFPAILFGKPKSLTDRPDRREGWLKAKNEHRLMCQRLAKGTGQQQEMRSLICGR